MTRPYYDPKTKYSRFAREEKKQEEEKPKEAQFVSALGLVGSVQMNTPTTNPPQECAVGGANQHQGKYPSVRKKFVPPFKKNENEK